MAIVTNDSLDNFLGVHNRIDDLSDFPSQFC